MTRGRSEAANTNTLPIGTAFNTLVLLTSSFTAVLAHQAAESGTGEEGGAAFAAYTMGGAAIFLCVKSVRVDDRDQSRLHNHVEHVLVVLLHRRRVTWATRDRGGDHHGLCRGGRMEG